MDQLLTLDEVAERLRTPPATLRFWRHQGTGPKSAKLGRRIIYREADVQQWLDAQYASTPDPAA
ncbi:MAG TPA: helix-turn-helix domain-containing protein [Nocardioidaceae bacterium]|nr:helix-turn-helix domain-containing protein [Nocardioidaceae bacterium]